MQTILALIKLHDQPLILRHPTPRDGSALHALIASCPPLDENSCYCNLLQCTHFAATSLVAENTVEKLVGSSSGYQLPEDPSVLFVWQVAVGPEARGMGLARTLLTTLIERVATVGVTKIHTTITKDNDASWSLFRSIAEQLNADLVDQALFHQDTHFKGQHATEHLVEIGPFTLDTAQSTKLNADNGNQRSALGTTIVESSHSRSSTSDDASFSDHQNGAAA